MKTRGFTLTELVVIIGAITVLMLILLPVLKRVKQNRHRTACANNFRQIGLAMLIYSNDYDTNLPRAGGGDCDWGETRNWQAKTAAEAFGLNDGVGRASISASFYLLVKSKGLSRKIHTNLFVCPGDVGARPFEFDGSGETELGDLWDFGPDPSAHVSYAYHIPYSLYPLTTWGNPGWAVAADRNPWLDSPGYDARPASDLTSFDPGGAGRKPKQANSLIHQGDGQNVLSLDCHVAFETTADCGVQNDNIYTSHNGGDILRGTPPSLESQPADPNDSLLLHDPPIAKRK